MVMCLERGSYLHMAQLMPLPLTVSCFSKIQIGFTFLVPACPGSPGKRRGLLRRLQSVQNAAARLVTGARRCDHITPVLQQLHWLPVRQRVVFKIAGLVHQPLVGAAPAYLADDCRLLSDVGRRPLRSNSNVMRKLLVPQTHKISVLGVSRPPVLDCGTTFHPDYGGRDLPSTPPDNL